jgi:hypothetical protein
MSCVIEIDDAQLSVHGWVTGRGERSAWVELNAVERSADDPLLGGLGELSLCGSPAAMRRLAEAIFRAVGEAERLPAPIFRAEPVDRQLSAVS